MAYTVPLSAPSNVEIDETAALTIALEWDIVANAASYTVEQTLINRTTGATTVTEHATTARAYAYTYTNADSATYSTVQFRLKSIAPTSTVFEDSDFSDETIVAIDDETARLGQVQNVRTANTATNLIVAWDAVANAASYDLEITTIETETEFEHTSVRNIAPPQGSTVTPTTYDLGTIARFQQTFQRVDVRVTAYGDDPDGEASDVLMWDVPTPVDRPARRLLLAEPTGVTALINETNATISLNWLAVPNAVMYEIEKTKVGRGGTRTTTYDIQNNTLFNETYTTDDRRTYRSFEYRVRALGYPPVRDRESGWSDRAAVTIPAIPVSQLLTPALSRVVIQDARQASLTYRIFADDDETEARNYEVEITKITAAGVQVIQTVTRTTAAATYAASGDVGTYAWLEFRIRSVPTSPASPFVTSEWSARYVVGIPTYTATPNAEAPANSLPRLATPVPVDVFSLRSEPYDGGECTHVDGGYSYDFEYRAATGIAGLNYFTINSPVNLNTDGRSESTQIAVAQTQSYRARAHPNDIATDAPSLWSAMEEIAPQPLAPNYTIAFSGAQTTSVTVTSGRGLNAPTTGNWEQRYRPINTEIWLIPHRPQASAIFRYTGLTPGFAYEFETRRDGGSWGGRARVTLPAGTSAIRTPGTLSRRLHGTFLETAWSGFGYGTVSGRITNYDLYASTSSTTPARNDTPTVSEPPPFDNHIHIDNLQTGTAYYFWLRARTATDTGNWNTPVMFTTAPVLTPPNYSVARSGQETVSGRRAIAIRGITHNTVPTTDFEYFTIYKYGIGLAEPTRQELYAIGVQRQGASSIGARGRYRATDIVVSRPLTNTGAFDNTQELAPGVYNFYFWDERFYRDSNNFPVQQTSDVRLAVVTLT